MSPPPATPPAPKSVSASVILHAIWHGVWQAMSASPWLGVFLAVAIVGSCVGFVRAAIHSGHGKDPRRRFSGGERAAIFARAGQRCEHHGPLLGRCRKRDSLEADHVHPHSWGGWTDIQNGQALCRRHNQLKRASVPWNRQLKRLSDRRAAYFPAGTPTAVTRHAPKVAAASRSRAADQATELPSVAESTNPPRTRASRRASP